MGLFHSKLYFTDQTDNLALKQTLNLSVGFCVRAIAKGNCVQEKSPLFPTVHTSENILLFAFLQVSSLSWKLLTILLN